MSDIAAMARERVLEGGERLTQAQIVEVLQIPDDRLGELLALAHEVRLKWCGPEVEVEGIVSLKTGGCPEDCHFCSQSGQFSSPVRPAWLDIGELVEAARRTRATGATEFCIVAAVRGPDARLMAQLREGVKAIREEVEIQVAASLGILSPEQAGELADMGVHRYNHNEDRRLPGGLPLLQPERPVLLSGPVGMAGYPGTGRGGQADARHGRDGVLHRGRRTRPGRSPDGAAA